MSSTSSFSQIDFSPCFRMPLFYFNLKCQYMRINAAVKLMLIPKSRSWGRHCPLYHLLYLCSSDLQLLSKHREEEQRCIRYLLKGRWNTRSVTWVYWAWLCLSSHVWPLTHLQISFFCLALGGPQCAAQQEEVSVCVKRRVCINISLAY